LRTKKPLQWRDDFCAISKGAEHLIAPLPINKNTIPMRKKVHCAIGAAWFFICSLRLD
jgi:hypothetical protein